MVSVMKLSLAKSYGPLRSSARRSFNSRGCLHHSARLKGDENKLAFPDLGSPHHRDLSSFLAYAERTGLDPNSTVYVGTHYEYRVASKLSKFGFALKRIGGASDNGIDLI